MKEDLTTDETSAGNDVIPWFDKWLPARFDVLYVLPSLVVQQIRQGDERTSVTFRERCSELRHAGLR